MVNDWLPAYVPASRDSKPGWYKTHQRLAKTTFSTNADTLIIGDSIALGLERYKNVWKESFHGALNLGIGGDSTQHVLWRVRNTRISKYVTFVVVHCGTNNIDTHQPEDIAGALSLIAEKIHLYNPEIDVILSGILPRGSSFIRKDKIDKTNFFLKQKCSNAKKIHYLEHSNWQTSDGDINTDLYIHDQLHLNENGNKKFANEIKRTMFIIKNENFSKTRNVFGAVVNTGLGKHTDASLNRKSSSRLPKYEKPEYVCPTIPITPSLPSSFSSQLRPKGFFFFFF